MENKGKKLKCPYGTTGRISEQSSPNEKFLITATKHREIKIALWMVNKDISNMLINYFSDILNAILRLINILVVLENMWLFQCSWKGAKYTKQATQRPKLLSLDSIRALD